MKRQFTIRYQCTNDVGKIDNITSYASVDHSQDCKEKLVEEYNTTYKDDPNYRFVSVIASPNGQIDWELMDRMRAVREICELGHKVRAEVKIKNKQPISKAYVLFSDTQTHNHMTYIDCGKSELTEIISDELNVDEVVFIENMDKFVNTTLKPNFKVLGPKGLGKQAQKLKAELSYMTAEKQNEIHGLLKSGVSVNVSDIDLTYNDIEVELVGRPGFSSASSKSGVVILDTNLGKELLDRGFVAEFRSAIQNIRKTVKLNLTDRISLDVFCGSEKNDVLMSAKNTLYKDLLIKEVMYHDISEFDATNSHKFDIDGVSYHVNLYKEAAA